MTSGADRERRWIVLGQDGRHVTLGRHTDPTAEEIGHAGAGLRAAGIGGWLAVMEGVYYRSCGGVSLMMVRELAPCRASWDEAVSALTDLRRAALKSSPSPAPRPGA